MRNLKNHNAELLDEDILDEEDNEEYLNEKDITLRYDPEKINIVTKV